jgi:predicted GNAT superfamily acetyltransferase
VQWKLDAPHVERRVASRPLPVRASDAAQAPAANETRAAGRWRVPTHADLGLASPRVWVEVPAGFTEMQQEDPDLALDWRLQTRSIFTAYFGRGYRAVDFEFERESGRGRYLLAVS